MKAIVFKLADQEYILDVAELKEIVRTGKITKLPDMPAFVEGTIKRRGRVVPIINLRKRLSLSAGEITVDSCIFIVGKDKSFMGFMVDSASEIIEVPVALIESPTSIAGKFDAQFGKFIKGVAYLDDRFLILLDLNRIVSSGVAGRTAA